MERTEALFTDSLPYAFLIRPGSWSTISVTCNLMPTSLIYVIACTVLLNKLESQSHSPFIQFEEQFLKRTTRYPTPYILAFRCQVGPFLIL